MYTRIHVQAFVCDTVCTCVHRICMYKRLHVEASVCTTVCVYYTFCVSQAPHCTSVHCVKVCVQVFMCTLCVQAYSVYYSYTFLHVHGMMVPSLFHCNVCVGHYRNKMTLAHVHSQTPWYRAYCALLLLTLHFSMFSFYIPLSFSLSTLLAFTFTTLQYTTLHNTLTHFIYTTLFHSVVALHMSSDAPLPQYYTTLINLTFSLPVSLHSSHYNVTTLFTDYLLRLPSLTAA